jgi:hypothetical protein
MDIFHKYIVISLVNISLAHRLFQSIWFAYIETSLDIFFFFFVALGFELRASCLLGKHSLSHSPRPHFL